VAAQAVDMRQVFLVAQVALDIAAAAVAVAVQAVTANPAERVDQAETDIA
jgi:chitodextrinase